MPRRLWYYILKRTKSDVQSYSVVCNWQCGRVDVLVFVVVRGNRTCTSLSIVFFVLKRIIIPVNETLFPSLLKCQRVLLCYYFGFPVYL